MSMNDGRWFAEKELSFRLGSIEAHREQIATEQGTLAGMLVSHAAALIRGEFPTAETVVFSLIVYPSDTASVQIAQVLDAADEPLEIAPDYWPAPQVIGHVESVLAEASDLGADFLERNGGKVRQVDVRNPLNGVRLPGRT